MNIHSIINHLGNTHQEKYGALYKTLVNDLKPGALVFFCGEERVVDPFTWNETRDCLATWYFVNFVKPADKLRLEFTQPILISYLHNEKLTEEFDIPGLNIKMAGVKPYAEPRRHVANIEEIAIGADEIKAKATAYLNATRYRIFSRPEEHRKALETRYDTLIEAIQNLK
jgi:hypothetical protein